MCYTGWKHTLTDTHCTCMCTKWVCFYSEAAKEDEEQAFLWNGGGIEINSSIHSIPSFRLVGPSPVMQCYTQMSQQQSCLHHSLVLKGTWCFSGNPAVWLGFTSEPRERESILCNYCYITMFLFIIWFSLNLPHHLCDSFPRLAKGLRISSVHKIATCFPILSGSGKEEQQNIKGQ